MILPEREELIHISTTLDSAQVKANLDRIRLLDPAFDERRIYPDCTVTVVWNVSISYWGGITAILDAFLALAAAGAVVNVSTEELIHGRSLAQEVFLKLDELAKLKDV